MSLKEFGCVALEYVVSLEDFIICAKLFLEMEREKLLHSMKRPVCVNLTIKLEGYHVINRSCCEGSFTVAG